MTVRMDNQLKAQFDKLCEQFGMSANTAINIFVKAVIRSKSIPFSIQAKNEENEEDDEVMRRNNTYLKARYFDYVVDEIIKNVIGGKEE